MTCEERQERLLLYAAHALEDAESAEVRAHLSSGCPRCAGGLAEAEAVLAHLPLTLDPITPSPAVRERLLERIHAQEPGAEAGTAKERALRPVPFPASGPADRWLDAWLKPAIAAGLAAAVVYGATTLPLRREREAWNRESARQAQEVAALRESLAKAEEAGRILGSPAAVVAMLAGSEPQPRAWGRILWDREQGTVHLYTGELQPPGPGRTYELWLITDDDKKIPAGTFDVDASRRGALIARVPSAIGNVVVAAVTDEPAGGVPQPTGSIQLVGKIVPVKS